MGILRDMAEFVKDIGLPPGFSVCELGDQYMAGEKPRPAIDFYRKLGVGTYVSIDGNGLGTVTADLNQPVVGLGQFDLVTDFGTGEHIFDQAQVFRTIHDLTKPGGYIVFDRPCHGYTKHCFYLVTTGLMEDIAFANGYRIVRLTRKETPRGWLCRGVFRKSGRETPFRVPQQSRYQSELHLPKERAS
jgi:SAM-dependent methyltransferase